MLCSGTHLYRTVTRESNNSDAFSIYRRDCGLANIKAFGDTFGPLFSVKQVNNFEM